MRHHHNGPFSIASKIYPTNLTLTLIRILADGGSAQDVHSAYSVELMGLDDRQRLMVTAWDNERLLDASPA